jgi:hypothetical protein
MTDYARIAGNLRRIAARNEYDQLSDRKDTSTEWHAANALETLIRERDEALAEAAEYKQALNATHQARVEGEKQVRAKAIEEAAAVAALEKHNSDNPEMPGYDPAWEKGWSECAAEIERAILALERKPE